MYTTAISLKNSSYSFLDINRYGFNSNILFFDDVNVTDCKTCHYPELTFQPQKESKTQKKILRTLKT